MRRADPWDRDPVIAFVRKNFHDVWAMETERAFATTPICCFIGLKGNEVAGFAVYEGTRRDYFGPTGVREDLRGSGLGAALLLACLGSMREMGYAYAIIGGVGPASVLREGRAAPSSSPAATSASSARWVTIARTDPHDRATLRDVRIAAHAAALQRLGRPGRAASRRWSSSTAARTTPATGTSWRSGWRTATPSTPRTCAGTATAAGRSAGCIASRSSRWTSPPWPTRSKAS